MTVEVICTQCGEPYPREGTPFICPTCGGVFDWSGPFPYSDPSPVRLGGMLWRWESSFGLDQDLPEISLGEGGTPLISDQWNGREIHLKLEYQNPTGSYKDRGSALLVSFLRSRRATAVVEDSSGNAGASLAAYAARAGMHARVFVPDSASGPKLRQIDRYKAEKVCVDGPRSAAAQAVLQEARAGSVYASHAFMPFGMAGIATIAYEIQEQLGQVPGTVIAPVGHASLLLGILRGFKGMQVAGRIDRLPAFVAVQSAACAPILSGWLGQPLPEKEQATLAEGVKVLNPVRGAALLTELDRARDHVLACDEEGIRNARDQLSRRGFDVEPTAALAWNAMEILEGKLKTPIVLVLTGSGLKYEGT